MVFQYTGAFPSSNAAHDGSTNSSISSLGIVVNVADAEVISLITLICFFFLEELLDEASKNLLPRFVVRDAFGLPTQLIRVADISCFGDAIIDAFVAAIFFLPKHTCFFSQLYSRCKRPKVLAMTANGVSSEPEEPESVSEPVQEVKGEGYGRILFSDVVVKRKAREFLKRKWNPEDISTFGAVLGMHLLCLFAPFQFNWAAFWVAFGLYIVTGLLGITLSFHRNLSHRSFKLPKWLEYFFAYCGVQALQGHPIDWVSTHRFHHQFCDSERDPHSPLEGFWFSHINWFFDNACIVQRCGEANNVSDLEKQTFYKFIKSTYVLHPLALGAILYALGGFPFVVWGMGVRIVWVYHVTWLVNSACHVWGKQSWKTGDLSRNNWWVAVLAFGEGWHNNHHAFEYSARHGLEWWQLDMTWYVVKFLQAIGLATDVKLPTMLHKQKMALTTST